MRQSEPGHAARYKKAFNEGHFTLYVRFSSTKKQTLKLAIGARAGPSTVRNRAKRQAREAFRLNRHRLPAGIEIAITTKRGVSVLSRRDMRSQILELLEWARTLSPTTTSSETVRANGTNKHR